MRTRVMRLASALVIVLLAGASNAAHAQPARALEDVRAMASAGAVDLALARIDEAQPRQPAGPAWGEWEVLRLSLLSRRHRHADVLARFKTHAGDAGVGSVRASLLDLAAAAAAEVGRFAEARGLLMQAFLVPDLSAEQYRAARRTAIEVYLAEKLVDAAYLAMLRFRHDFAPLAPAEAERFVAGLIAAGRFDEAAGWLSQLDPASPSGALLRLRAGLLAPAAAAAQARALLAKGELDAGWTLLSAAGHALADPAIGLEVLEQRLNGRDATPATQAGIRASLWKAYLGLAQRTANEAQLLAGDDASWLTAAERLRPKRPGAARALLAGLAIEGRTTAVRTKAQSLLLAWLRDAGLARSAWRLFAEAERFALTELDSRVRLELGELAAHSGDAATGLRFWHGLPPMDGLSRQQWQARNLTLMLQAGLIPQALKEIDGALDPEGSLDAETMRRLLLAAREALELGHIDAARTVLQRLAARADDAQRMSVLTTLARAYESGGDPRAAAEAYLVAAAAVANPAADPAALAAREAAASSLLRAGLRADAREVLEWIARHAKSAEAKKAAEGKLSRL